MEIILPNGDIQSLLPIGADEPLSGQVNGDESGTLIRPFKKVMENFDTIVSALAQISNGSGQMLGTTEVKVISFNAQVISEDILVPANLNASMVGPVSIAEGCSVTISDGSRLIVL